MTLPERHMNENPDLRQYVSTLRYRKWSVFGAALLVVAGALAFSFRQTPVYRSESKVLVTEPRDREGNRFL